MPDLKVLFDLISQLQGSASPRPDLITPGSTGKLENARPATFAGRVTFGGESPQQILARMPSEIIDEGFSLPPLLPSAAVVLPARTAQESFVQDLMKQAAVLWKRAQADPRELRTAVKKIGGGALGQYDPATETITVHPNVLAGRKIPRQTYNATPAEITIHELAHFLNRPKVTTASPARALESSEQITKLLEGRTAPHSFMTDYVTQAKRLSETAKKHGPSLRLSQPEQDLLEGAGPRRAYTEALSYLAQEGTRTTDPLLKALADAFNER